MVSNEKILVIAAHPDDEVLGCGGTIARMVQNGCEVHVLFISDGITSRSNLPDTSLVERRMAAELVGRILGIRRVSFLDFPDNQLDRVPLLSIVKEVEKAIAEILPRVIFTHYSEDLNIDHRITYQAVMTACRPLPKACIREIYSFEVLSSTEWSTSNTKIFTPNLFVDITNFLDKKREALIAYHAEMRAFPHSRSIEHSLILAKHRGSSVGIMAAEAFVINRILR